MSTPDLIHRQLVDQHVCMLAQLRVLLTKAGTYAAERKFPEQALTLDRLAPDMHPLNVQVRIACDVARLGAARLAGQTPPDPPALEDSVEGLCRYVDHAIAYLGTLAPQAFARVASQKVAFPWKPGKVLTGHDYFFRFVVPNVYFHVAAVYMILRTNGLDVGKADFLGELPFVDA